MLPIPSLKATLSHVSPDKAAQIRSVVTGALTHSPHGLFCFERTVETTFVLPWDLDPKVQPEKLSTPVRDGIRSELLDVPTLQHLEGVRCINWNTTVLWQCRTEGVAEWSLVDVGVASRLEEGYSGAPAQWTFQEGVATFQVDYHARRLFDTSTSSLFELRRLAFAPLMPMKVCQAPQHQGHPDYTSPSHRRRRTVTRSSMQHL